MSATTRLPIATTSNPGWRQVLFSINAVVAWLGIIASIVLSAGGFYPGDVTVPSQLGYANPGAFSRLADSFSYFTIWSNITVAIVLTVLALRPTYDTPVFRVLRLDSVLMITVTGLVYAVVLAPDAKLQGWEYLSNTLIHIATPLITLAVWGIAGPRGWIRWSTVGYALILPLVWVTYTLIRGAVISGYPYPFIDVIQHGYGTVFINVAAITALGLLLCAAALGIDRLLARRTA